MFGKSIGTIVCAGSLVFLTACSTSLGDAASGINQKAAIRAPAFEHGMDETRGARNTRSAGLSKQKDNDFPKPKALTDKTASTAVIPAQDGDTVSQTQQVELEGNQAIDETKTASVVNAEQATAPRETIIQAPDLERSSETETTGIAGLPETYQKIADATRAAGSFAGRASLDASGHRVEAHKQSLLPQLRPGASVTAEGDTIASVNVDQVVYDSGRYSATKGILLSEKDTAAANLGIEENDKISNAISAYIQFHRAKEAQALVTEVAGLYAWFENQAKSRIANGIGDISEQDLFNLKKIESEAEYDTFESEAYASEKRLKSLANISMPVQQPARMKLGKSIENAPQLKLAAAERDRANNQLDFEKADRMPRVSLNGNVGTATDTFDEEDLDLRLEISMNQPLNWGFNHDLAASRSELEASNLRYEDTRKEILDEIALLTLEIRQAEARIERLLTVMAASKKRLNGFDEKFQAGTAGIAEAASIIETYRRSGMNLIDSKYTIYNQELELASLVGVLTP